MEAINIENIEFILQNIPTVLQYWLPGYWAILLFSFCCSKKIDKKATLILSVVLSYLSMSVIQSVHQIDNIFVLSSISFALLTLISVIVAGIFSSKRFKKSLVTLFHKTPNDTIWRDIIDFKEGSNLKVYLKGKDYYLVGHYKNCEERGDASWFALSAFFTGDIKTGAVIDDKYKDNDNVLITFRLSDVDHIVIFN